MADGHVTFMNTSVADQVVIALCTRCGGETISDF